MWCQKTGVIQISIPGQYYWSPHNAHLRFIRDNYDLLWGSLPGIWAINSTPVIANTFLNQDKHFAHWNSTKPRWGLIKVKFEGEELCAHVHFPHSEFSPECGPYHILVGLWDPHWCYQLFVKCMCWEAHTPMTNLSGTLLMLFLYCMFNNGR